MAVMRISNFVIANCRKNCRYIFGDFFISAKMNEPERVFEIMLHKSLPVRQASGQIIYEPISDYIDIEKFKRFWGAQWRITLINSEQ